MTSEIKATFEIKGWDEQAFDEAVGVAKLTSASVSKEYAGDIDGSSAIEWLTSPTARPCSLDLSASKGPSVDGVAASGCNTSAHLRTVQRGPR
jgi:Protein of unknown function (DUF3224)